MTKKDDLQQKQIEHLAKLVKNLKDAFSLAEDFATKHSLSFSIEPAYGMGGWFDGITGEWRASSQGC